jgi:hypothetical protein
MTPDSQTGVRGWKFPIVQKNFSKFISRMRNGADRTLVADAALKTSLLSRTRWAQRACIQSTYFNLFLLPASNRISFPSSLGTRCTRADFAAACRSCQHQH